MKRIILFLLFSFSAFGNYAKLSEVESSSISKVFTRMKSCGNDCIKIPFGYDSNYHRAIDEMINDYNAPIQSKSEIEICADEVDCNAKNDVKVCLDNDERVIVALDYSEIYCSKITGYEQVLSGRKIVAEDVGLKTAYLAAEQSKKDLIKSKKDNVLDVIIPKLEAGSILTPLESRQVLLFLLGK